MARSTPLAADGNLTLSGPPATAIAIGDPAWWPWLADSGTTTFRFEAPEGSFTARREAKHDGWYWYAYRRRAGRLRRVYLGKGADLTPARLAEVAVTLTREVEPATVAGGNAQPHPPLLATKLFVPRPHPDLVARPRLLARLDAGLAGSRCTVLSAQAGSGKTSLLAAWLAISQRPVAWLSFDERDQDVHQVLRYIVAALQTIARHCGRTALAGSMPRRPHPPRSCSPACSMTLPSSQTLVCWCSTTITWCARPTFTPSSRSCSITCRPPCIW